ncbi:glycerol-3-phosphate acyltransferase, partial [Thiolapillus sp.]
IATIWLFVAKVMNVSSLAALVAMALAPVIVWWFWPAPELVVMQVVMSMLLFWRHRSNIQNLLSGREGKITQQGGK